MPGAQQSKARVEQYEKQIRKLEGEVEIYEKEANLCDPEHAREIIDKESRPVGVDRRPRIHQMMDLVNPSAYPPSAPSFS